MEDLKFDLDKLREMKQKCSDLLDGENGIVTTQNKLKESLEQLKIDWGTAAGEKFFSDLEIDWDQEVAQCKKYVTAVSELLDVAIDKYGEVEIEANNLKIF